MNKFVANMEGSQVPLITPYGENEEVDYVQYEKLIDYIVLMVGDFGSLQEQQEKQVF